MHAAPPSLLLVIAFAVGACTAAPPPARKSGPAIAADPALPSNMVPEPRLPSVAHGDLPIPSPIPSAPPPSRPRRVPSFKHEVMPYLASRCASARGCHGNNKTSHVDLDLRPYTAYAHLVNRQSDERPSAMLVKPRDPDDSFVVAKLMGKLRDKEGTAMPRDEQDDRPVSPIPYDPDFIDNALVPWIAAGAPNN